jgi:hypothetical protein
MRPCGRPSGGLASLRGAAVYAARWLSRGPDLGAHHPAAHRHATNPAPTPFPDTRCAPGLPQGRWQDYGADGEGVDKGGVKFLREVSGNKGLDGGQPAFGPRLASSALPLTLTLSPQAGRGGVGVCARHPSSDLTFARPPPGPPLWLRAFVVRKAHLGAFRALRAPLLTPQGANVGRHLRSGQRSTWVPSDEVDAGVPFAPCGRRCLNEVKADEGYWQKV